MPRRVAILHYAAPPIVGGVEVTIYHHARLLTQAGYQVGVIAGRGETFHPGVAFHLISEVNSRHPEVLSVGQALATGEVPSSFAVLRDRLVGRLRPLLEEADDCIVHNAITLHKNLALTAALRNLVDKGVTRFIAWCHDFAWQDELYTSDLHPGYPWDLMRTPWPGLCYVVDSAHRRRRLATLLELPAEEIKVVHPGVDVTEFLKLELATCHLLKKLDLLAAEPLMLLPARITRRKNLEFAIRVTAALVHQLGKTHATLLITGPPGPHNPTNIAYLESLRGLRDELDVVKRVHLLYEHGDDGRPLHVTDAMMADFYQLADLLLFPSFREGFGIPPLEAGLARLPIFGADIPALHETSRGLAHFFDPTGDPIKVADDIVAHMADDPLFQMRRRVLSQFTWDMISERYLVPLIEEIGPRR